MAGFVDDNTQRFPHGSKEEIFNIPISTVVLLDYDGDQKVNVLAEGVFSIELVAQAAFAILACVCSVARFQWPVTKDTVIVRMAVHTFVIGLPGLLYGLQFPKSIPNMFIENLATIFMKFSHYLDLNENWQGYPFEENTPNIWNMMRPRAEAMANEALTRLGQPTGKSRYNIGNKNSCYRRASRMSTVTKFVIDSMIQTGRLIRDHLVSFGSEAPQVDQVPGALYPSINVFTCLVDSTELLWLIFFSNGLDEVNRMLDGAIVPLHGTRDDIGYCLWSVNVSGHVALLRIFFPFKILERNAANAIANADANADAIANEIANANAIAIVNANTIANANMNANANLNDATANENANANVNANVNEEVEVKVKVNEDEDYKGKVELLDVKAEVDDGNRNREKNDVRVKVEVENENERERGKRRKIGGGEASTSAANNIESNVKP